MFVSRDFYISDFESMLRNGSAFEADSHDIREVENYIKITNGVIARQRFSAICNKNY